MTLVCAIARHCIEAPRKESQRNEHFVEGEGDAEEVATR
jgi:hypothetical protein